MTGCKSDALAKCSPALLFSKEIARFWKCPGGSTSTGSVLDRLSLEGCSADEQLGFEARKHQELSPNRLREH